MELKLLDNIQTDYVYNTYMTVDFPADELKPLSHIHTMLKEDIYSCYGFFEGELLKAYAYIVRVENCILIDYLAVLNEYRGRGVGSELMLCLKKLFKGKTILIECENVAFAADPFEKHIRQRRIAFYESLGFVLTGISSRLFDAEYVILSLPEFKNTALCDFRKLYLAMLKQERFDRHLIIRV